MPKAIKQFILGLLCVSSLLAINYAGSYQKDRSYVRYVAWYAPVTTNTLQGDNTSDEFIMEIRPAGTIAALTVNLEPLNQLRPGSEVDLCFTQIVTALTVNGSAAGGATISGTAATAAAVNSVFRYVKLSMGTGSGAIWRRMS